MIAGPTKSAVVIDTHVHLYPSVCSADETFDFAWCNLAQLANHHAGGAAAKLAICLLDFPDCPLRGDLEAGRLTTRWSVRTNGEPYLLKLERSDGKTLEVILGQQWAADEGIEVVTVGPLLDSGNERQVHSLIAGAIDCSAVPVLPWGAGKWLGRRGRLGAELLDRYVDRLQLCDNGGRPTPWLEHPLFARHRSRGGNVLAGSDPLPIRGDLRRAGSYANRLDLPSDADSGVHLLAALQLRGHLPIVGQRVGPTRFALNQARLRLGE